MKVYAVWYSNFQSDLELCQIYQSRESAEEYIKQAGDDGLAMSIEEMEVFS